MKHLLAIVVAALALGLGLECQARPHRHHHPAHVAKQRANHLRHRARHVIDADRATRRPRPARDEDEIVLSPSLMKQLQHHLADAGYLDGAIDGCLSGRTRHALAGFQHDYHLRGNGALTQATAEALLGRETIGAYIVAAAAR